MNLWLSLRQSPKGVCVIDRGSYCFTDRLSSSNRDYRDAKGWSRFKSRDWCDLIRSSTRRKFNASDVRCRATDYVAHPHDPLVLRLDPRAELEPGEIKRVFGYPRNLNEKYVLGRIIGAGSYGIVRMCTQVASGDSFAVKTIRKGPRKGKPTPRFLLKLRTEVEIMQQLGNSLDVVTLKDVFEDDEEVHLVMEICQGGSLSDGLKRGPKEEAFIAGLVRSILRFISQCHAKGFIYRDVKPDNFLFLSKAIDSPLKATDFGLSIKHWPEEPKLKTRTGTAAYMAPELIAQCYDEKADMWSVGMLTYQMLTGRFPYWEDATKQTLQSIVSSIVNDEIDWEAAALQQLSKPALEFLQQLLERDPAKRLSAIAALQHPWIAEEQSSSEDSAISGSVVQRLQRFSTYGTLKKDVLKLMVDEMMGNPSTSPSSLSSLEEEGAIPLSVAEVQALFDTLDSDGSGTITEIEFGDGLRQQGYQLTSSEVRQLMKSLDLDNSDSLCPHEFMTTFMDWNLIQKSSGWQELVDRAFKKLDLDGDGAIGLDEIVEHLRRSVLGRADNERLAEAKQMLRETDRNLDGLITKEELARLLEETHQRPDHLMIYDRRTTLSMSTNAPVTLA